MMRHVCVLMIALLLVGCEAAGTPPAVATSTVLPTATATSTAVPTSPPPTDTVFPIELSPADEIPVEEHRVLLLEWGSGPRNIGAPRDNDVPGGFDVSPDGMLAIMDGPNNRVLFYNTKTKAFSQCVLQPWAGSSINIDRRHWFAHLWSEPARPTQKYLLIYDTHCQLITKAQIYADAVYDITDDWEVEADSLMAVIDEQGNSLSEEEQHASTRSHDDLWAEVGEVEGIANILHDDRHDLAFEFDAAKYIGSFYRKYTDTGYVAVGFVPDGSFYRVTWLDTAGNVIKDVLAPRPMWNPMAAPGTGIVAREDDTGDIYVIGDTSQGIAIYRVTSP